MLRTFLSMLLVGLITWGLFAQDVEAKRFGGGRSFGVSRSTSNFSRSSTSPAFGQNYTRTQQPFGQSTSSMSRWFGPLAGLITGGLLASLFMSNGLGSGILSWLLIGGLLLVVINLFRSKMQPARQASRPYSDDRNYFARDAAMQFMQNNRDTSSVPVNNYPVGFDGPAFLRNAKVQFIRLQAAYDQKNLNDIREFTTPEVFAEVQLQLQELGSKENKTHVLTLEAELLQVENETQMMAGTEMQTTLASVRFTGMIQEDRSEAAVPVKEIWHFRKETVNQNWLVAGIQQD